MPEQLEPQLPVQEPEQPDEHPPVQVDLHVPEQPLPHPPVHVILQLLEQLSPQPSAQFIVQSEAHVAEQLFLQVWPMAEPSQLDVQAPEQLPSQVISQLFLQSTRCKSQELRRTDPTKDIPKMGNADCAAFLKNVRLEYNSSFFITHKRFWDLGSNVYPRLKRKRGTLYQLILSNEVPERL